MTPVNEFELIDRLTRDLPSHPSVVVGPGDDCAVLDLGLADRWLLFKTDAVVENVHFLPDTPPEKVGHKALGRCLSDIAAMGGDPVSAVVTLTLPPGFSVERAEALYRGLNALAARHQVAIVGGETTANPAGTVISIAVVGTVPRNRCLLRSTARAGDALFVTGTLGGSLEGHHLDFEPRLVEARWLAREHEIHAMIDLSDGLAGDLPHLLHASRVGAELLARAIPISAAARLRARRPGGKPARTAALTDGEDFELLFTVSPSHAIPLLDAWKLQFPHVRLTCIGRVLSEPGLLLRDPNGVRPLDAHGYVHFPSC